MGPHRIIYYLATHAAYLLQVKLGTPFLSSAPSLVLVLSITTDTTQDSPVYGLEVEEYVGVKKRTVWERYSCSYEELLNDDTVAHIAVLVAAHAENEEAL